MPFFCTLFIRQLISFPHSLCVQVSASKMAAGAGYAENLRKLATFRTLEEFWGVYTHLLRADELPKDSNYHVFREGTPTATFISLPVVTHISPLLRLSADVGVFPLWRLLDHPRASPKSLTACQQYPSFIFPAFPLILFGIVF